ncbi:chromobox protein 1 [Echinococcus multilocularis]|uniref:Chromobox protein 1 n=1 Tax=Echinococcus multilocularis TaxID=6211 RepID=A0A068YEQ2_ECHMU|nr:chromobox protein 1 [Echinococcus multilocularis]
MMTEVDLHESEDSDIGEGEYQVEKIVKVRIRGGKKEYLLKWKGYAEEDNSWEPEENLDCPDLIKDFEERMLRERSSVLTPGRPSSSSAKVTPRTKLLTASEPLRKRGRPVHSDSEEFASEPKRLADESSSVIHKSPSKIARGFARGLKPDRIIGATDSSGELMFLIKWKDSNEADLVPAREAHVKCPQTVIRFYEERLTWHTPEPRAESAQTTATTQAPIQALGTTTIPSEIDPPAATEGEPVGESMDSGTATTTAEESAAESASETVAVLNVHIFPSAATSVSMIKIAKCDANLYILLTLYMCAQFYIFFISITIKFLITPLLCVYILRDIGVICTCVIQAC